MYCRRKRSAEQTGHSKSAQLILFYLAAAWSAVSSPYDVTVVAALFRSMNIKMSCRIQNMIKYQALIQDNGNDMYLVLNDYGDSISSNL